MPDEEIPLRRFEYEQAVRQIQGSDRWSPDSSDSEISQLRDIAAENLRNVELRQTDRNTSAVWIAREGQRNIIEYNPNYQYFPQSGEPGYTAEATLIHELHHEEADVRYRHPADRNLRGVNFHLPGQDPASPTLRESFQRQFEKVEENWERVRKALADDKQKGLMPQKWVDYIRTRIEYAQFSANVHNESVAAELYKTLKEAGLHNTQTASQVKAIRREAGERGRDVGGEVREVPLVSRPASPVSGPAAYLPSLFNPNNQQGQGRRR